MGTAERLGETLTARIEFLFLFAVARWGQRNKSLAAFKRAEARVSMRCREMGTAEQAQKQRIYLPGL